MQDSFFYLTIGIIGAALGFIMRKKRGAIKKAAGLKILFFPVATLVGAILGGIVLFLILPVIERSTNSATVVYAFVTGFLVSGTVPILVPLFIGG